MNDNDDADADDEVDDEVDADADDEVDADADGDDDVLTIPVLKGGIQRHRHPSPDGHVPRVVVLHVRVVLVQLPVHVARHEVGAFVEAPGEDRVDVLHVRRDAELRDGAPFSREPRHHSVGIVRPVPVACSKDRVGGISGLLRENFDFGVGRGRGRWGGIHTIVLV